MEDIVTHINKSIKDEIYEEAVDIVVGRRKFISMHTKKYNKKQNDYTFNSEQFTDLESEKVSIVFEKVNRSKAYYYISCVTWFAKNYDVEDLYEVKNGKIKCLHVNPKYANDLISEDEINDMILAIEKYT